MSISHRSTGNASRRAEIAEFVKAKGTVRIDELAGQFGVSTMTIHRDLDHLHAKGSADVLRHSRNHA